MPESTSNPPKTVSSVSNTTSLPGRSDRAQSNSSTTSNETPPTKANEIQDEEIRKAYGEYCECSFRDGNILERRNLLEKLYTLVNREKEPVLFPRLEELKEELTKLEAELVGMVNRLPASSFWRYSRNKKSLQIRRSLKNFTSDTKNGLEWEKANRKVLKSCFSFWMVTFLILLVIGSVSWAGIQTIQAVVQSVQADKLEEFCKNWDQSLEKTFHELTTENTSEILDSLRGLQEQLNSMPPGNNPDMMQTKKDSMEDEVENLQGFLRKFQEFQMRYSDIQKEEADATFNLKKGEKLKAGSYATWKKNVSELRENVAGTQGEINKLDFNKSTSKVLKKTVDKIAKMCNTYYQNLDEKRKSALRSTYE